MWLLVASIYLEALLNLKSIIALINADASFRIVYDFYLQLPVFQLAF